MINLHETDRLVERVNEAIERETRNLPLKASTVTIETLHLCLDALTAMGRKAEPVAVKLPVWSEVWVGSSEDIPAWRAQGTLGWNRLIDFAHDHAIKTHADAPADRLAEKKRAVQSAYENAIRSTLSTSPVQARAGEVTEPLVGNELFERLQVRLDTFTQWLDDGRPIGASHLEAARDELRLAIAALSSNESNKQ